MTSIWTKSAILRFWVRYWEVLLYLLLQSYKGLSKTSKSHLVFAHLTSFCEQIGIGLARFSEQTFERTHSQWVEYSRYRLIGDRELTDFTKIDSISQNWLSTKFLCVWAIEIMIQICGKPVPLKKNPDEPKNRQKQHFLAKIGQIMTKFHFKH